MISGKTPVSALQELVAARGHPLPRYVEEGSGTDFKCTVYVEGITAVGRGTSKKTAKHNSADNALKELQSQQIIPIEDTAVVEQPLRNYVGELNEYSSKHSLSYPAYEFVTALVDGKFVFKCTFLGKEVQGVGLNKKDAKQIAAKNMLELVGNESNHIKTEYKIQQQPTKDVLKVENTEHIMEMFQQLSMKNLEVQGNTSRDPSPEIKKEIAPAAEIPLEDLKTPESLEQILKEYEIEYTLKDFQKYPYIVSLIVKNTNLTFMGIGNSKEEAKMKVYKDVLLCKKSGFLNDCLTSFQ